MNGLLAWWSALRLVVTWHLCRGRTAPAPLIPADLGCACGRFPVLGDDVRLLTGDGRWSHARALCCPASEVIR